MQKIETSQQKMETNNVKFTNRDQNMRTKRLNNPNHYTIITFSKKNQTVRATKKNKRQKKEKHFNGRSQIIRVAH